MYAFRQVSLADRRRGLGDIRQQSTEGVHSRRVEGHGEHGGEEVASGDHEDVGDTGEARVGVLCDRVPRRNEDKCEEDEEEEDEGG